MIQISKSPTADTRTAKEVVSKETLLESSREHRYDVRDAMYFFSMLLRKAGQTHDWTKIEFIDEFYDQFHKAQETGEWGKGWYDEIHIKKERHHLKDGCPDDVNLIDVIEQICDGVMAGMARQGQYREEEIPSDILSKAYKNTVKMLLEQVIVKQEKKHEQL